MRNQNAPPERLPSQSSKSDGLQLYILTGNRLPSCYARPVIPTYFIEIFKQASADREIGGPGSLGGGGSLLEGEPAIFGHVGRVEQGVEFSGNDRPGDGGHFGIELGAVVVVKVQPNVMEDRDLRAQYAVRDAADNPGGGDRGRSQYSGFPDDSVRGSRFGPFFGPMREMALFFLGSPRRC